jgi:hypothetical protein
MRKDAILRVRTTAVERIALTQLAERRDRNVSELTRAILRQALDAADRDGVISLDEIREGLQEEELPEARRAWGGG